MITNIFATKNNGPVSDLSPMTSNLFFFSFLGPSSLFEKMPLDALCGI